MYAKILVPIDGSAIAAQGLTQALGLARELRSKLILLNVVNEYPLLLEMAAATNYAEVLQGLRSAGEQVLAEAHKEAEKAGVQHETVLREVPSGRAANAILEEAESCGCELIVMGTHGRRGLTRLTMGSDAELVVRGAPVPVLLVRAQEESTT